MIVGILISFACIGYIISQIDLAGVRHAVAGFEWPYLLFGLISFAFGYASRVLRWTVMLRSTGAPISISACAGAFMGSMALNNVLPARLGDVVRALVFPAALGVTRAISTGTLVLERLTDLLSVLSFLAAGLAATDKVELSTGLRMSALLLAAGATVVLITIVLWSKVFAERLQRPMLRSCGRRDKAIRPVLEAFALLFSCFDAMSRPTVLVNIFFLSALAWAGEVGLFWSLLIGLGLPANASSGVLVMAIAALGTLIPLSPGYVGPFHLAAYAAVSFIGGTSDQAASFAVLAHASVWLPTSLIGGLAILMNPRLFRLRT
ncbi:lysylphosphatidylglycerol synthase transmembrane domain-containing protein [Bradyrhizobium sp. BR 1432]|uniref:lysylphosphatidylglycerol synthase transmembrane domain-containing protein n=1 Tax=Bradyrhizobium sp. BR 1432 TaxID=3447966 RepID=UPI003EE7E7C3